jgi:RNA polymerase sigma-70 factor (ECF subfamily)
MKGEDRATHQVDNPGPLDARAVTRALSGDLVAFDELVKRYQRRAVAVAYRLIGDSHDAWDVAQDAFVRAYRSLGTLQDRERFGPWLMRIVSNLSLNYRRSRKTAAAAPLDLSLEAAEGFRRATGEGSFTSPAPDEGADAEDLAEAIRRAMLRLPEKQRMALTLFSVEGMSQKEVAEIMDCSIELVKWNVFQARKQLKKMLASFLDET